MLQVKFIGNLCYTTVLKTDKTVVAPHLSRNISSIYDVFFILYPPVSKQTPLPTKAIHSLESGFPLKDKFTNVGSFLLPLPTACKRQNPFLIKSSPLITVNERQHYLFFSANFYEKN